MIAFATLKKLCHYKSLTPSKSMSQKSNDMKFGKEVKTIIVVDTSLHSLNTDLNRFIHHGTHRVPVIDLA